MMEMESVCAFQEPSPALAVHSWKKNGRVRNQQWAVTFEYLGVGNAKQPSHVSILGLVLF